MAHELGNCQVRGAGPTAESNQVMILLSGAGTAGRPLWYVADGDFKREMLATALTAMTTGHGVYVHTDKPDEYSTVCMLYMMKD
jgi:hypothetical protein